MVTLSFYVRHVTRFSILAATTGLAFWGGTFPAHAQVIEIDDDGSMKTFAGPTQIAMSATVIAPITHTTADAFERSAASNGLDPRLLRAVAWTESRGRSDAVSPKGARGVMQLMPRTAAALGVDPTNVESNIAGGAAYLAQQIGRFQSVALGLAAYNAGPGAVLRWGGIPPYRETQAYVASVTRRWLGPVTGTSLRGRMPITPLNTLLIEVNDQ